MRLKTKRLILREIEKKDVDDLVRNINTYNVSKWLLVVPYPYTKRDAKSFIFKCKEKRKEKPRVSYEWVIELKKEKKPIGGIGLYKINKYIGKADFGYWIAEKYWRQGYGYEALSRVIDFAFNKLKLRRLEAGIYEGNPSYGKLIEKCGGKIEGKKIKSLRSKADGKIHNEILYAILKENWKKK